MPSGFTYYFDDNLVDRNFVSRLWLYLLATIAPIGHTEVQHVDTLKKMLHDSYRISKETRVSYLTV